MNVVRLTILHKIFEFFFTSSAVRRTFTFLLKRKKGGCHCTVIINGDHKALDGLIIRLVYNSMRTKDLMKYALPVYAKRTVNQIIQEQK